MKKRDEHKHCWHVTSSSTDGLGQKGTDDMVCCFCGRKGRRAWFYERDRNHGSYAQQFFRIEGPVVWPKNQRRAAEGDRS